MPKQPHRDPRFESLSGNFDKDKFRNQYSFLYNDVLPKEKAELKKALQQERGATAKLALQKQLSRVDSQLQDEKRRRVSEKVGTEYKVSSSTCCTAARCWQQGRPRGRRWARLPRRSSVVIDPVKAIGPLKFLSSTLLVGALLLPARSLPAASNLGTAGN